MQFCVFTKWFRMLGYSFGRPTNQSHFGSVSSNFAMDNVKCTGSEDSLLDCPHEIQDDCNGDEGAGVICSHTGRFNPGSGRYNRGNIPNLPYQVLDLWLYWDVNKLATPWITLTKTLQLTNRASNREVSLTMIEFLEQSWTWAWQVIICPSQSTHQN